MKSSRYNAKRHESQFWQKALCLVLSLALVVTPTLTEVSYASGEDDPDTPTTFTSGQPSDTPAAPANEGAASGEKPAGGSEAAGDAGESDGASPSEESGTAGDADVASNEETIAPPDKPSSGDTPSDSSASIAAITEGDAPAKSSAKEEAKSYTLHLTHYFRFTVDGKKRNVSCDETIALTSADFKDGICDLSRFAYDVPQLTVTEAHAIALSDFDGDGDGGARIVYAVDDHWRIVAAGSSEQGSALRSVFNGQLSDYEFVPANVLRVNVSYKYSNTGGMAGRDAAAPQTIEAELTKQNDGAYTLEWNLPEVEGFRIVLDPAPLNAYLVKPPTGEETPEQLEAALDRGDFNVDTAKGVYYGEMTGGENPNYLNRYSDAYNEAWNNARTLSASETGDRYSAQAEGTTSEVVSGKGIGANRLTNPKVRLTFTDDQLQKAFDNNGEVDLTVYYRRNAVQYTVKHWVPQDIANSWGNVTGKETQTVNGVAYVCYDVEAAQGRVGAMTTARAKTTDGYKALAFTGFTQKVIADAMSIAEGIPSAGVSTGTVVDIFYKAADSYRVIFDTNYTYIPRQQVALGSSVDFTKVTEPKRQGYTFGGWYYPKKDTTPNADGEYAESDRVSVTKDGISSLIVDAGLITNAQLVDSGGVLALHLYPLWIPDKTQVRVILWTENLDGKHDVQATATGGNPAYYTEKYRNYSGEPKSQPVPTSQGADGTDGTDGTTNFSNVGSFVVTVGTASSLVDSADPSKLLGNIQTEVESEFWNVMQEDGTDTSPFFSQAGFRVIRADGVEDGAAANTAEADGKTAIYVYFTRNVYELKFHYYGRATVNNTTSDFCVANKTNGFSYAPDDTIFDNDGNLKFDYSGRHENAGTTYYNSWLAPTVSSAREMPVPQTISIKAKYGADLRDVWPTSRSDEQVACTGDTTARMISWGTTDGKYRDDAMNSQSSHYDEPTIMGTYASMSAEIVADPNNKDKVHHLVAYWYNGSISHYRFNHCYEIPDLDINAQGIRQVSIYNNSMDLRDVLYIVPNTNAAFERYNFSDLIPVSYQDGTITYGSGDFYAVRAYKDGTKNKYYAVARRVETVSSNTIAQQAPSQRQHMTRANGAPDHSSQYADSQGSWNTGTVGTADSPYDLYYYYDRDRYTITYMVPENKANATSSELTLGTVTLPFGAKVSQGEYGYELDYRDTNTSLDTSGRPKYGWNTSAAGVTQNASVCPDRATNGTAEWKFKGWALGPMGANMRWSSTQGGTGGARAADFAIEGNMRLYAIWNTPTYTVTFHLNGGVISSDDKAQVEVPANMRYTANGEIPRPVRDGYTLAGWYVSDANGNPTLPQEAFDFDADVTDDIHVAAVWNSVSAEKYAYNVYYVTPNLSAADTASGKTFDTVRVDEAGNKVVAQGGTEYYVLAKAEYTDQQFIENGSVHLTPQRFDGYISRSQNKALALTEANKTYDIVFCYDPVKSNQHVVRFVEAGTEKSANPTIVKTMTVKADQVVPTPDSKSAKELTKSGYQFVSRGNDGTYAPAENHKALTWIDEKGAVRDVATLKGDALPGVITYLVQPISYTISYENEAGAPNGAAESLSQVTAPKNTALGAAAGKNPTLYTVKDSVTLRNPGHVRLDGEWFAFTHWTRGAGTNETLATRAAGEDVYTTLSIDPGSMGNLSFVAHWAKVDAGSLMVTNTVAGEGADMNRPFNFTVTLDDLSLNDTFGGMEFKNGVATFALKHGESMTATGLPVGIGYRVVETDANSNGYVTSSVGEVGDVAKEGSTASFVNTLKPKGDDGDDPGDEGDDPGDGDDPADEGDDPGDNEGDEGDGSGDSDDNETDNGNGEGDNNADKNDDDRSESGDKESDAPDLGKILAQTGDNLGVSFAMGIALVALSLTLMKLAETNRKMRRKMDGRRH